MHKTGRLSKVVAPERRMEKDVVKLIDSPYEVTIVKSPNELHVKFPGPGNTLYAGGIWTVRVVLPSNYPFRHPSVTFLNKIYHPNISVSKGAVCLDVIRQTWTPLYDLVNIFETFLPQLLTYPNPDDPLNEDAAALYMKNPEEYQRVVKVYVERYATKELGETSPTESDAESSLSEGNDDE